MMNILKVLLLISIFSISNTANSQDLLNERIRKIPEKKRSIFFKKGIFHSTNSNTSSVLKSIRHGNGSSRGYERLVFDFKTKEAPRVYGYKSEKENKIYIDFFKTKLDKKVGSFGTSKLVKKVDFYPVGDDTLSAELVISGQHSIDVFTLTNPGRLVIDIKK
ncbi:MULTISPECIES: hypothetical protein [Halobacteriovorax]|uniref:AMIN domain-containing protein n=1 Tax=Halobacteriovorax vibrionivorans TaxID=2152716 RepID=A0ABY0IJQ0_9BACT|nr:MULTISPECIES: hypothetical protein [Halobacteriovorax]RZF23204.1 hypothetical protein DAY19_05390 [Halobacteriovorax vibrionivorans]TGD46357.1 hypothetical protein EP118_12390 [Halobacteriovorax sp. Y22]